jgi:protein phosphatase
LVIREQQVAILWAGDSRAYRLRAGSLERLTVDHSEQEPDLLADKCGDDSSSGAAATSTAVTRAVGGSEALELDLRVAELEAGDRYLLCSDGLTHAVSDRVLRQLLSAEKNPELCARRLLFAANQAHADDNVTAVIIDA